MATVALENIGPISKLSFDVPDSGGLVVLRGSNGSGKSTAIDAIQSAMTGRGKPPVQDGKINGTVEAFGVTMKVGRSKRVSGELEVQSLEGKLDVATLVDPGIKSPEAADARRIKALVQLAKVQPSAELFYELAGGREAFDALVSPSAVESDDLVQMAERIKRDLEAAARNEESQAEHAEGRFRAAHEATQGVDLNRPSDSAELQATLEEALKHHERLKSRREAAQDAAADREHAQSVLADAETAYDGPKIDVAKKVVDEASQRVASANESVEEAKRALAEAQRILQEEQASLDSAARDLAEAERHEENMAKWREVLAKPVASGPTDEELTESDARVVAAREAVETGVLVRKAKQSQAEAETYQKTAKAHRNRADQLREAAKGTDDVLSEVVGRSGSNLRVMAGRLVLETKRGETFYSDLSAGERWKIALDIAIEAVGPRGVLPIPQEAYEGLDGANRQLIAEHVKGCGVIVLTAECSDSLDVEPVSAQVYGD